MRVLVLNICLFVFLFSCKKSNPATHSKTVNQQATYAIAIHGGAGTILKENMTPSLEVAYKNKLKEALLAGETLLKKGGTSLDAVQQTIRILENSPLFNAGKGAVFTHNETNEHDASIMDGKTLKAGASAGTQTVKNPIDLARAIMENSPHVMLSGKGADQFAKEQGLTLVDSSYFYTTKRFHALQKIKERSSEVNFKNSTTLGLLSDSKFGTVGCVALDKNGDLAAGTSTGGMTNKRWGRIGDSPIIGAGTYANNKTCAVSATGWGEYFIRSVVAYDVSALMEYKKLSLEEASRVAIYDRMGKLGGTGGIIAIDKNGNISMEFNTAGMYRASTSSNSSMEIKIYTK